METRKNSDKQDIKASVTALSIGMGFMRALDTEYLYLFSQPELDLIRHLYLKAKQSLNGFNWVLCEGISLLPYALQQSFFNKVVVPAYDKIIVLRKYMIKTQIEEAIQKGARHIVFLGGGYDIRAIMLSLYFPDIKIYELDRGPTREHKLKGIRSIPKGTGFDQIQISEIENDTVLINKNLHYINCDLGKDNLFEKLNYHGFMEHEKTLFIAEGLTPYLTEVENIQLLNIFSNFENDENEFLLSFMSQIDNSKIVEASLKSSDELHHFSLSPSNVVPFVTKAGCSVFGKFDATTRLSELGDEESAKYYLVNKNQPKEYYYLLKKASHAIINNIDEVPNIQFALPSKPIKYTKNFMI